MKVEDVPGSLASCSLNEEQMYVFTKYMNKLRECDEFYVLFCIFYVKDALKFLDIFSGRTIKVPKRKDVMKSILYVKIYMYIKKKGFDEASVYDAAKKFGKRVSSVIRIYNKMDETLDEETKKLITGEIFNDG